MTKKIKAGILLTGSVAVMAAPIALAISCGNEGSGNGGIIEGDGGLAPHVVTIQAEKTWVPVYTKAINAVKAEHGDELVENEITDIRIVEAGSFDNEKTLTEKGLRDEALADVFLFAADKTSFFDERHALRPYYETSIAQFETNRLISGDHFNANAPTFVKSGKVYGVPENVEAMVVFTDADVTTAPTNLITRFSDLWMSAGFFNDGTKNLKDIVKRNTSNGDIMLNGTEAEWNTFLTAGFNNLLAQVNASGLTDQTAFANDSAMAAPKINQRWAATQSTSTPLGIIAGPWDIASLTTLNGSEIVAHAAPATYKQWRGGWLYGLNARMTNKEANVAELVVEELMKPKYAAEMFTVMGKNMPTTKGAEAIHASSLTDAQKATAQAIYDTPTVPRPVDSAFNIVWGAYSGAIDDNKTKLASNTKPTSAQLTKAFMDRLKAAITLENSKH